VFNRKGITCELDPLVHPLPFLAGVGETVQWTWSPADPSYSCIMGIYNKGFLDSFLRV